MFFAHQILHRRKGKYGLLWMASTSPKFIRHVRLLTLPLAKLSEELKHDLSHGLTGRKSLRFSHRLSCRLISGLWILYSKKMRAIRAEAEDCLRMLNEGTRIPRDSNIDLPKSKRLKKNGVPATQDVPADFGKLPPAWAIALDSTVFAEQLAAGNTLAEEEAVVQRAAITVDRASITLPEEVPLHSVRLEDEEDREALIAHGLEGGEEEGGDIIEELDRLLALRDEQEVPLQEEAAPPAAVGEPISPIAKVDDLLPTRARSVTPPLAPQTSPGPHPEVEEEEAPVAAEVSKAVAAPERPDEVPAPEEELVAVRAVDEAAAAAAMPPPPPPSPPAVVQPGRAQRRRRRQASGSPPQVPVRRRRRGPIIDVEPQLDLDEMRQNMRENDARPRIQDLVKLPKGMRVEDLFRLPGRRLLSERLLRPWKRIRTLPEPTDRQRTEEEAEPEPVPEPVDEPVLEPVSEPVPEPIPEIPEEALVLEAAPGEEAPLEAGMEAQGPPDDSSLEVVRAASLSHEDTAGGEAQLMARPSGASLPLLETLVEEEPPEVTRRGTTGDQLLPALEEEQPPLPEEQPEEEVAEAVPRMSPPLVPAGTAAEEAEVRQPRTPLPVWERLREVSDEHGMCTLEQLVPPDVFNRRTVAATFGALLRLHKRGMVHLSQDVPFGPLTIEMRQDEEDTPPVGVHRSF